MDTYKDDPTVEVVEISVQPKHDFTPLEFAEPHYHHVPRERFHLFRKHPYRTFTAVGAVISLALCFAIIGIKRPDAVRSLSSGIQDHVAAFASSIAPSYSKSSAPYEPTDNPAFLSFLGEFVENQPYDQDYYYTAVRIMGHQLMHAPATKSHYPFVVAVTSRVDLAKRAQLEADGATVVEVASVRGNYTPLDPRYRDMLTKLSIFSLYGMGYDRFCYLDADTLLLDNMDGIFADQAAQIQTTKAYVDEVKDDEPSLPATYLFAGHSEHTGHHEAKRALAPSRLVPRTQDTGSSDYMNGGFVVFAPGPEIHAYYMSLVNLTDRWNSIWNEQNMWNYAHRRRGNMPWTRVADHWNVIAPKEMDVLRGAKSVHAHLWVDGWLGYPGRRHELWMEAEREMEEFYGNRTALGG